MPSHDSQAYSQSFARIYNLRWGFFASHVAPFILEFYRSTPAGQAKQPVLDLCCGTGVLAAHFLQNGYPVVGLDLSEPMLRYAREKTLPYIVAEQARFVQGDASDFHLEERFGLVVSTFDALNHLESEEALANCFRCAWAVCDDLFIFDLNTPEGLRRWNSISVDEGSEEAVIITRGIYDEAHGKAWTRITGFIALPDGNYERFEQTAYNTAFDLVWVKAALMDAGFQEVYFARVEDLRTPIAEPEKEKRVFIVAKK